MSSSIDIVKAHDWVKEANRSVAYGVCFVVAGAIAVILGHDHELPMGAQVGIGTVFGLIAGGMITESNFFESRKHLKSLQSKGPSH